jgi:RNA-binding protein NOB1
MGIPIISTDGYKIKSARRFILECHICQTLVRDATKLFCPSCGNDSLLKVSCSIESDGTIILYRKKNFKVNLRGT